MEEGGGTNI